MNNIKAAVYCGTRNIYQDMIPSMKSLLIHSDVDKIYFLIEDDEFPYPLPPEVECINVSNQEWFRKDGPNYRNAWSYMVLMRAALPKIFPNLNKILSLDCDIIIDQNISELWDIQLDNYYIAAVKEPKKSTSQRIYINTGVVLFNLKKIRDDKKDDACIADLNTYIRFYPEQDCFNDLFYPYIFELPADYNVNNYTSKNYKHRKIRHFAAIKYWQNFPVVDYYRNIEITRNVQDMNGLDIIIPFYNNITGLEKTLDSIVFNDLPDIHITVVDDCSIVDISDIQANYPSVQFLRLEQNSGPGIARQYGIDHTNSKYIMFVDTGDYILSKYSLKEVLEIINNDDVPYMHLWRWLNEEHHSYSGDWNPLMHGWVIKRDFLNTYNIRFCEESSRSNEDFGFIQSCNMIIQATYGLKSRYSVFHETPIYMYTYDAQSITHADNKLYMYTTHMKGRIANIKHVLNNCKKNNINHAIIVDLLMRETVDLYAMFLLCAKNHPEVLNDNWKYFRDYYLNIYIPYSKVGAAAMNNYYHQRMTTLLKCVSPKIPNVNINKFFKLLEANEEMPEYL